MEDNEDNFQELFDLICEIETEHKRRMSKFYKKASKRMLIAAIFLLVSIMSAALIWLRSTPNHPVLRFCIILFDCAIMIFDLHQSYKYARFAEAYTNERKVSK